MRIQAPVQKTTREALGFEETQRLQDFVKDLNADRTNYSLVRAIMSLADARLGNTLEAEISQECSRRLGGISPRGIFVPLGLRFNPSERALSTTPGAGGQLVFTRPGSLIEMLRSALQVGRLGATLLDGLQGPILFPKQLTAGTLTWVEETPGSDVGESDLTTGSVGLTPKSAASSTAYSRQLLAQSSIDVEALVRADLVAINAVGIDKAAIQGTGTLQPLGILNQTGIGLVEIAENGGYPTLANLFDLESLTFAASVRGDSYGFLTTPGIRGYLRKTLKIAGSQFAVFIWPEDKADQLLAYPAFVSNNVPSDLVKGTSTDCHAILFGNWSDLIIGTWGVVDVIVDPYRLKKQAVIEVTSFVMVDVAVRYPVAFAVIKDARIVA